MLKNTKSKKLYSRARKVMVGGVSSPVRAFKAVGGAPLFISKGKGPNIWDADGEKFIDYVCSWGALILGHSNSTVVKKVSKAMESGSSFGAPTIPELMLAEKITGSIRSIEKVRFVNSGTEATMSAIRLARGYTNRTKIVKFEGCYHGHSDAFLSGAGSGLATLGIPTSSGVLPGTTKDTITVPYNDISALENVFRNNKSDIAAVILEPVAGNMGVVPPKTGFLSDVSKLCSENGSLLIFDEVITGFRVSFGGAQRLYGITPDITCLGKIIGGGLPVGAYGARKEIMNHVAPEGPVYQAGTLSGNPLAMTAGLTTLSLLNDGTYRKLEKRSSELADGITEAANHAGIDVSINRVGSMFSIFFTHKKVEDFSDAKSTNKALYTRFFWGMLKKGVYIPPSGFEAFFVSAAHQKRDINNTIHAFADVFKTL